MVNRKVSRSKTNTKKKRVPVTKKSTSSGKHNVSHSSKRNKKNKMKPRKTKRSRMTNLLNKNQHNNHSNSTKGKTKRHKKQSSKTSTKKTKKVQFGGDDTYLIKINDNYRLKFTKKKETLQSIKTSRKTKEPVTTLPKLCSYINADSTMNPQRAERYGRLVSLLFLCSGTKPGKLLGNPDFRHFFIGTYKSEELGPNKILYYTWLFSFNQDLTLANVYCLNDPHVRGGGYTNMAGGIININLVSRKLEFIVNYTDFQDKNNIGKLTITTDHPDNPDTPVTLNTYFKENRDNVSSLASRKIVSEGYTESYMSRFLHLTNAILEEPNFDNLLKNFGAQPFQEMTAEDKGHLVKGSGVVGSSSGDYDTVKPGTIHGQTRSKFLPPPIPPPSSKPKPINPPIFRVTPPLPQPPISESEKFDRTEDYRSPTGKEQDNASNYLIHTPRSEDISDGMFCELTEDYKSYHKTGEELQFIGKELEFKKNDIVIIEFPKAEEIYVESQPKEIYVENTENHKNIINYKKRSAKLLKIYANSGLVYVEKTDYNNDIDGYEGNGQKGFVPKIILRPYKAF
tara:strand:+ start:1790 stop:3490 length:1701 start_codon:yes stop_codon:yes gene_type:complete